MSKGKSAPHPRAPLAMFGPPARVGRGGRPDLTREAIDDRREFWRLVVIRDEAGKMRGWRDPPDHCPSCPCERCHAVEQRAVWRDGPALPAVDAGRMAEAEAILRPSEHESADR
jgi:hypothetical protein